MVELPSYGRIVIEIELYLRDINSVQSRRRNVFPSLLAAEVAKDAICLFS